MIVNLTQHPATPEQLAVGVVDLPTDERRYLIELLTFDQIPDAGDIYSRVLCVAGILEGLEMPGLRPGEEVKSAMIGGAPYLMGPLEAALKRYGVVPLYAFSVRESTESVQADGSVRKVNTFRHAGFVRV